MVQQTNFDDNASHDSTQASVDLDMAAVSDGQFKNEVQYIEITCITHQTKIFHPSQQFLKISLSSITSFIISQNKQIIQKGINSARL